jgi:PTS system nitrogen regulatory IIA component
LLSELAQMFSDRAFRESLLAAPDATTLHALFTGWQTTPEGNTPAA